MTLILCEACRLGCHDRCIELRRNAGDRATPIACWCDCDISQRQAEATHQPPAVEA